MRLQCVPTWPLGVFNRISNEAQLCLYLPLGNQVQMQTTNQLMIGPKAPLVCWTCARILSVFDFYLAVGIALVEAAASWLSTDWCLDCTKLASQVWACVRVLQFTWLVANVRVCFVWFCWMFINCFHVKQQLWPWAPNNVLLDAWFSNLACCILVQQDEFFRIITPSTWTHAASIKSHSSWQTNVCI